MILRTHLLVLMLVISSALMANGGEIDLPYRHEITSTAIGIQLNRTNIVIIYNDAIPPSLEIRNVDPEIPGTVDLALRETATLFSITSTPGTLVPPNTVVELILSSDIPTTIKGDDLRIQRVHIPRPERNDWNDVRGSHFELDGSSLDFRGAGKAWFRGINTDFSLSGTLGDHGFITDGGTVTVNDHVGNLTVETTDTAVSIRTLEGNIEAQMAQGRLSLDGMIGKAECDANQSNFDINDHDGTLRITGDLNDITVRQSLFQRLDLSGESLSAQMLEGSGPIMAALVGGSLNIEEWNGRVTIQARTDADLELGEIDGDVVLTLTDHSTCRLSEVTGHTRGSIDTGDLKMSLLKSVEFSAIYSVVTATEIPGSPNLTLSDSTLTFSATELRGKPRFDLKGRARADVEIPAPCTVQLEGPGKNSSNVEIQGCDISRGQDSAPHRRKKRWETRNPITLTVSVGSEADLRIEGLLY